MAGNRVDVSTVRYQEFRSFELTMCGGAGERTKVAMFGGLEGLVQAFD